MMKYLLNRENFWTIVVWVVIFMVILYWDQEKIVVLNLVLFCYFLYWVLADTIDSTLSARNITLIDTLILHLSTLLGNLKSALSDATLVSLIYTQLIKAILKKTKTAFFSCFTLKRTNDRNFLVKPWKFVLTHFFLQNLDQHCKLLQAHQSSFILNQSINEFDAYLQKVVDH